MKMNPISPYSEAMTFAVCTGDNRTSCWRIDAPGVEGGHAPSRKLHPPHKRLESRVPTQRIKDRIHVEVCDPAAPILDGTLDPIECPVGLAESKEDRRERDRRHVLRRGGGLELTQDRLRLRALSCTRERVAKCRARVRC